MSSKKVIREPEIINRIVALMESGQHFILTPYDYTRFKKYSERFKEIQLIKPDKFKIRGNIYKYHPIHCSLNLVEKKPYADVYVITTLRVGIIADTLNTLDKDRKGKSGGWRNRVVGWYPTLEQASKAVITNYCDISEGMRDYCVIEKLSPGIYPNVEREWWFKWNNHRYKSIPKKPDLFDHCTNFGIG